MKLKQFFFYWKNKINQTWKHPLYSFLKLCSSHHDKSAGSLRITTNFRFQASSLKPSAFINLGRYGIIRLVYEMQQILCSNIQYQLISALLGVQRGWKKYQNDSQWKLWFTSLCFLVCCKYLSVCLHIFETFENAPHMKIFIERDVGVATRTMLHKRSSIIDDLDGLNDYSKGFASTTWS